MPPGDRLQEAIAALPEGGVTLSEIVALVGHDGLMILAAFLTLVFLVPVSIPGVSTVFGAGILLIGISRLFRRDLWVPQRIGRKVVATDKLKGALGRGLAAFRKLERFSRPERLRWATASQFARVFNDLGMILGAVLLMFPFGLIPFSNTLPAIALLFLAIGSLQRDGVSIVLGHVANIATIIYFAVLIGGGGVAIKAAIEKFF